MEVEQNLSYVSLCECMLPDVQGGSALAVDDLLERGGIMMMIDVLRPLLCT